MTQGKTDVERWLENWQDEVDGAFLYAAMAEGERRSAVADIYRRLGAIEGKHATFWEEKLRAARHTPRPRRPTGRARVLAWLARRHGAGMVLPTLAPPEPGPLNLAKCAEGTGCLNRCWIRTINRFR